MALDLNLDKPLSIIGVVLAAVVGLSILAALLPTLFDSTQSITENVTAGETGSELADNILQVLGLVVPVAIIAGIVGLVFFVANFRKK